MVNISKDVLSDHVRVHILRDLMRLFVENETASRRVWRELMSDDEQLQYAKRIALVLMLTRGVSYDAIQQTLHMSPSTIAKHDDLRKEGRYRTIESRAGGVRTTKEVLDLLDKLLRAGLPAYCDRHRYKWLGADKILAGTRV